MKKKRYTSVTEIEKEIDKLKWRSNQYFAQAEANDKEAIAAFGWGHVSEGHKLIKLAHNRRRRAMQILDKKLPVMGEKMAEFLTTQLPGVDNGDTSIPAY